MRAKEVEALFHEHGASTKTIGALIEWAKGVDEHLDGAAAPTTTADPKTLPPNFNAAEQEAGDRERAEKGKEAGKADEAGQLGTEAGTQAPTGDQVKG